jgi:hypothetical protein
MADSPQWKVAVLRLPSQLPDQNPHDPDPSPIAIRPRYSFVRLQSNNSLERLSDVKPIDRRWLKCESVNLLRRAILH